LARYQDIILQPLNLLALTAMLSFLLVAPLPLLSLKFSQFGLKGNELRYLLIYSASILLIVLQAAAIPLIIALYILLSVIENTFLKKSS
jgi:CDP-diacylglycerol--serine O-phosphatidyltransferase